MASLNQNLYIAALKMTSATLAVAMTNLLPAFTFILAVMFRLERLEIRSSRSQAKVLGTAVGVCGAMLLTFYHGAKLQLWSFHTHLPHHHPNKHQSGNQVLGSMLAMANTVSYATWLIMQGILLSGLVVALISWAIPMRGPLFVSAFSPLSLVIVAFFGSIFLDEALHLGSVVGAGLIILGLYTVLWGKGKEVKELVQLQAHRSAGEATKLDSDGLHLNSAGATIGADQVPEHSIKEDQIDCPVVAN
ncbi:WAT1-related protein At1g09380-like isoform X2 [Nymphaea colorata]|uniref:WAT1-related protein At1g09380-like isoform X2 n=1 Tax=Nymphaea colorata TaxID=210225 RepID=UPI00129E01E4|nr:WAT1-related protein At1g09380-like isoform X2 [Nymphaea colorata]